MLHLKHVTFLTCGNLSRANLNLSSRLTFILQNCKWFLSTCTFKVTGYKCDFSIIVSSTLEDVGVGGNMFILKYKILIKGRHKSFT